MITTPLSRLADILNVNISSMNRADAQDAVCTEAEKNIRANQHRINQLHSRVDQTERENAELRAMLEMAEKTKESPASNAQEDCTGCRYPLSADGKCYNPYCSNPEEGAKETEHD